jgi:two-component system chemotaxis response regulator CheB
MIKRDVVAIGCSAGGVEALPRVLLQLPAELPAAVLIVQHLASAEPRYLAGLLDRRANIEVGWAEQGAPIVHGRAYVAPPDAHLLVADGHVLLSGGAREQHARPSIDKTFRSVADAYASRAIGVLLTGMLEDGVAGLGAIRDAGGSIVVQDPNTAAYPDMPRRAVTVLKPELVVPLDRIGGLLVDLLSEPAEPRRAPSEIALEASFDRQETVTPAAMNALGEQTSLSCPECGGPLWDLGDPAQRRYRCYLGHAVTAREIIDASDSAVESALWSAVRALHDRATALEQLGHDSRQIGNGYAAQEFALRAKEARTQASLAHRFMLDLRRAS